MSEYSFTNREVAQALQDVAGLMRLKGENRFRVAAMDKAAANILELDISIAEAVAQGTLEDIQGVGKGIAAEIASLFAQGRMEAFAVLSQEFPVGLLDVMRIPNVGPRKAAALWQGLGIASLPELYQAARDGQVQTLKGFSGRSESLLLTSIEGILNRDPEAEPIGRILPAVERLMQALVAEGRHLIAHMAVAGELRQWRETIREARLLIAADNPEAVAECAQTLPSVARLDWISRTACRAALQTGYDVILVFARPDTWWWELARQTGDDDFWQALVHQGRARGCEPGATGWRRTGTAGQDDETEVPDSEEAVFAHIDMPFVVPELRTSRGIPLLHAPHTMPDLVAKDSLRGELHAHSTYSDGRHTIEEMAQAAMQRGYTYWGVTDHGPGHGFGDSLDMARLAEQAAEIEHLNHRFAREGQDFRLLQGIEAEILADGSLGLPDGVLATLDVVVASIHSGLRQEAEVITARCLKAISNSHVHILGHPTSRLLGRRGPSALDVPRILEACRDTGTAVEINCNPARLDLNDTWARQAADMGCLLVMNCDAHSVNDLEVMRYGVGLARRAGLEPEHVLNTRPLPAVLSWLHA